MTREQRLEFESFDGATEVRVGQGDHCVFIEIRGRFDRAFAVLTDDEAEALARSLKLRVKYAREAKP